MTLANRIVMSPMCRYSASQGRAANWHMIRLGQLALSRAGILDIEASAVEPAGRITPADLGLWDMRGTGSSVRSAMHSMRARVEQRNGVRVRCGVSQLILRGRTIR
jgi:2,4-dienoyl-CoA reductase-like NADH-dependent reductase (Old Yellow Enzyme family)